MKVSKRSPIWLVILCLATIPLAGCVSKSEFETLQAEFGALRSENASLETLSEQRAEEIEDKNAIIEEIQNELDNTIEELSSTKQELDSAKAEYLAGLAELEAELRTYIEELELYKDTFGPIVQPEETDTPPPAEPEESQVIEDLAYIKAFAWGYSDDADPESDGISLHITFYDTKSERIVFQDTPVEVTIKLYAYEDSLSSSGLRARELVHTEQVTIDHTTWLLGYAEIKMSFEDIGVHRSKLKYGSIKVTVTTPNQGKFTDNASLLL